jgi:hypothetical protein
MGITNPATPDDQVVAGPDDKRFLPPQQRSIERTRPAVRRWVVDTDVGVAHKVVPNHPDATDRHDCRTHRRCRRPESTSERRVRTDAPAIRHGVIDNGVTGLGLGGNDLAHLDHSTARPADIGGSLRGKNRLIDTWAGRDQAPPVASGVIGAARRREGGRSSTPTRGHLAAPDHHLTAGPHGMAGRVDTCRGGCETSPLVRARKVGHGVEATASLLGVAKSDEFRACPHGRLLGARGRRPSVRQESVAGS